MNQILKPHNLPPSFQGRGWKISIKSWWKPALFLLLVLYIFCLPSQLFTSPYSTVVTDRNGELLGARIATDGQWRFPPRDNIPEKVATCLIEFEDRQFYHHWGVNPLAIGRAVVQNLKHKRIVSGGSTLTMQTIRLARNKPRTFKEKLIEMVWATRLEFRKSKKEILSLYISHAPFGGNVVGLDAAAWRYFGHSAEELSWAESAMLAVLPNSPAMIHLSKSRQALLDKRNRLLTHLHKKGILDTSTYELAISEPLPQEPLPLPHIAPHLTDYFYQTRNGKYSVSTIDRGIQTQIESLVERWNSEFKRSDIRNLAILVIDIRTNQAIAYCGNVHFDKEQSGNQVDVIRSPRSTGSILKPFLYYAMLQEGEILPNTLLPDIPVNINGFAPQNFNLQFEGAVPASEAIARSLNIPSVTMLQRYGVPKFPIVDSEIEINKLLRSGKTILCEGAQGTMLDVDFGSYPFVTSSNTICAGACTGLGVGPNKIGNVYGIMKAYCTRVGSGPFPTELFDETGNTIRDLGHEYGAVTGRERRCGWVDLVQLRYSIMVDGVTELIMMKSDVLDSFDTIKACVAYRLPDGTETRDFPYEIDNVEPIYKELKGWKTDMTKFTSPDQFPQEFKDYIKFLEDELETKIGIISIGPDREQTITL